MPSCRAGEYPRVARNQPAVLAHQRRRRPAPLLDARGYRGDLGIRVGPCIFGIRDQPVDRPPFDLIGRPRPLISVAKWNQSINRPPLGRVTAPGKPTASSRLAELEAQQLRIPPAPGDRQLIVGQDVARFCASLQPAATITGISAMPSCRAARTLA